MLPMWKKVSNANTRVTTRDEPTVRKFTAIRPSRETLLEVVGGDTTLELLLGGLQRPADTSQSVTCGKAACGKELRQCKTGKLTERQTCRAGCVCP